MRNHDILRLVIMLIAVAIIVPLGIWWIKLIVESDLPTWLKGHAVEVIGMIWTILRCAGSVALGVVIGKWILRKMGE